MLETNVFFGKQWFFFKKAMFFDTTSHIIYFYYKAYALKKLFMLYIKFLFITQSLIQSFRPCYSRTLINSPLFCTSPLWNNFYLVVKNRCVFLVHIFWNCAFFPRNVREKRKTQTKIYHWLDLFIYIYDLYKSPR